MKQAGIAIDNWKIPFFEEQLKKDEFPFSRKRLGKSATLLKVQYKPEEFDKLQETVEECERIVEKERQRLEDLKNNK